MHHIRFLTLLADVIFNRYQAAAAGSDEAARTNVADAVSWDDLINPACPAFSQSFDNWCADQLASPPMSPTHASVGSSRSQMNALTDETFASVISNSGAQQGQVTVPSASEIQLLLDLLQSHGPALSAVRRRAS
jgi:hypothetical protein